MSKISPKLIPLIALGLSTPTIAKEIPDSHFEDIEAVMENFAERLLFCDGVSLSDIRIGDPYEDEMTMGGRVHHHVLAFDYSGIKKKKSRKCVASQVERIIGPFPYTSECKTQSYENGFSVTCESLRLSQAERTELWERTKMADKIAMAGVKKCMPQDMEWSWTERSFGGPIWYWEDAPWISVNGYGYQFYKDEAGEIPLGEEDEGYECLTNVEESVSRDLPTSCSVTAGIDIVQKLGSPINVATMRVQCGIPKPE